MPNDMAAPLFLSMWLTMMVLTAVGFVLSLTVTPVVAWVGALCLIVGGLWLAREATRGPIAAGMSDSTERPNTHVASASAS